MPLLLRCGRYIEQLERYIGEFPREQLLVVLHEDLVSGPRATLARIFSFLGVDPSHPVDTSVRHNVTAGYVQGRQDELIASWLVAGETGLWASLVQCMAVIGPAVFVENALQ